MNLTIIIATRGRPEILKGTLRAFLDNITEPDTTLLVCIDSDDKATIDAIGTLPKKAIYSVKPREDTRGLKYERALTEAPADLYMVAVDHTPIRTKGFDRLFLDAAASFPDGIGVVCTPMANASFPFLQALTRRFVEISGFVQPPQFPYWFIDHWTDDIARMIGRYRMVDVAVESSRRPGNTTALRDVLFWASYYDAIESDRREQASRLIEAMDEPDWRKAMLRDSFPMIEYRSKWVNDQVRLMARQIEQSRGEQSPREVGYLRALKAAVEDWEAHLPAERKEAA